MKVLILLSVICLAFATEDMDPCLKRCKDTMKTKFHDEPTFGNFDLDFKESAQTRTKFRTVIKNYINNGNLPHNFGNVEMWTKLCTISREAETCANACPNSPQKEDMTKFLGLFKLGCNEEFKSTVGCLADVNKQPSQECQTKCHPLGTKAIEFINQREAQPDQIVHPSKDVLESLCKFINCRVNCRKTDIINKCQEKGFEETKKLWSAVGRSAKMFYKCMGGDMNNWPEICKADNIIKPHNY